MMDIDFEAQRREIDLEMKRQDELERFQQKEKEQQWQKAVTTRALEPQLKLNLKDDLRLVVEKNRDSLPHLVPPSAQRTSSTSVHVATATPQQIPGLDRSRPDNDRDCRNQSRPLGLFRGQDSGGASLKCKNTREELVKEFTKDCDTVALVTQMLIDEDPSLEGPLVRAMKGVLQKVMQKHLDSSPN